MVVYYISEKNIDNRDRKIATIKVRDDLDSIFRSSLYSELSIPVDKSRDNANYFEKIMGHVKNYRIWMNIIKELKSGDILILQFPLFSHTVLFFKVLKYLHRNNVKIILILHDLNCLRINYKTDTGILQKKRIELEEKAALAEVDVIIAHNDRMLQSLVEHFGCVADRIIPLKMFDYLIPNFDLDAVCDRSLNSPIIIAGNLRHHKAGYTYCLPNNGICFNLYGVDYRGSSQSNVSYKGAFDPNDLPFILKGSFGLVWDGPSSDTCEGAYGEYLRINNPHKVSLYLATGIPVIVWNEAAVAEYVELNECGFAVGSLHEISERLSSLTEDDYRQMLENTRQISLLLQDGMHTKQAIKKALEICKYAYS